MIRFLQKYTFTAVITLIISTLSVKSSFATHLRAGEITVKRISATTLTYRITLTTYTDQIGGIAANEAANSYKIFFGVTDANGNNIYYDVLRRKKILINPATMMNVYDTVFTYPAAKTYHITCGIQNRNANTVNLPPPTDQISFFVETTLVVNSALGLNRSPVLLNAPLDSAGVGKRFIHNPGAFDADGDSLAYRMTICKKDIGSTETGIGEFIPGYRDPTSIGTPPLLNQDGTGPATLTINPLTGDLIWDAPRQKGQYNVAFIVEEWRKGLDGTSIKIGEITRDMQIIVVEDPNTPPVLTVPANICIEAGSTVNFKVTAKDKENNNLQITSSSGVYNKDASGNKTDYVLPDPATFVTPSASQKPTAEGTFNWNTNCTHVRQQAYDVLFKVVDLPGRLAVQFADIKTVKITVVAPRPKGLAVTKNLNGNLLNWQKYPNCNAVKAQIIVYRKEGCTNFQPSDCLLGMPATLGYKEIARVAATDTTYTDKTAQAGVIYSYRLVATLANNDFVENQSVVSNEACIGNIIPTTQVSPVMTNVTVDQTSTTAGQITVKWTQPLNANAKRVKSPYQYQLQRSTGLDGTDFTQIATFDKLTDTVFVDKNLNTTDNAYRYRIGFSYVDSTNTPKSVQTSPASSVRLTATSSARQIVLNWQAIVPWNNENQTHRIYREVRGKAGVYNKIAEISVKSTDTFTYTDNGTDRFLDDGNTSVTLSTDSSYCYKIETVGTYANLKLGLLYNMSQVSCASPVDTTRPCSPVLSLDALNCSTLDRRQLCDPSFFKNILKWQSPATATNGQVCRNDVAQYKIYYAKYKDDNNFQAIATVDKAILTYTHQRNQQDGFIGCYYITAVNPLGLESAKSNVQCNDNCPLIEFPNVFTPNGDGKNDVFAPLNCPAYTQLISIEIYNRDGVKVYESSSPTLSWDGKNNAGVEMPTGTYLYVAKVQFVRLDKSNTDVTTIKGMVELIR